MTFSLYVDGERWRKHQASVVADLPDVVPVAKGNGYGLGVHRLAEEARLLGVGTVAAGELTELPEVRRGFDGDVLVLAPYHPATSTLPDDPGLVLTVSHLRALEALSDEGAGRRVVLELATSMRRHGFRLHELPAVADRLSGLSVEGLALHLPMTGSHLVEAGDLVAAARAAGLPSRDVWVSHLSSGQVRSLADSTGARVRPRVGTRLWLGDRGALQARGTVLDVHPLSRGDRFGYRQRQASRGGHLLVVTGGTQHGVGMAAPSAIGSLTTRAKVLAEGGLEALGRTLSPFTVAGRQRYFAEPPHMQVSMVLLPERVAPPAIGDELDCAARLTTTYPDRVVVG